MPAVLERDMMVFDEIKESVKIDDKGRVIIGRDFSGRMYRVSLSAGGEILLTPIVIMAERDMWLYKNPQAQAMFQQGLADAQAGRVTAPEDFSQYADAVIEDE